MARGCLNTENTRVGGYSGPPTGKLKRAGRIGGLKNEIEGGGVVGSFLGFSTASLAFGHDPMKYLNELLVAVGIGLLAYGFNQPWSAYGAAEVKRIEFMADTEKFAYAYSEFARRVNEQIALHRSCIEQGQDCDEEETQKK